MARAVCVVLVFLLIGVLIVEGQVPGGWSKMSKDSDLYKAAVEYLTHRSLPEYKKGAIVEKIISGEQQVVAGMNCILRIVVKTCHKHTRCCIKLYRNFQGEFTFKAVQCFPQCISSCDCLK